MELVDVTDSKSVGSDTVWVRVPPPAPSLRERQSVRGGFFQSSPPAAFFYQNNDPAVQRDFMRSPYEIGVSCFLCSVPVFQSAPGNPPPRFSHAGAMDQPVLIAAEILFMSKKNRYDQTHHSADQVSGD